MGRAQKVKSLTDYLSGLTVSQGRLAGQAFAVLPWQRRFVRGAFAPGIQAAALSIGRGNGKTTLLAGIAAATLDGPLAVPRGETVIVASSFEQARIAFEHVLAFMDDKLKDRERWKTWDTAQQARIEDRKTGSARAVHRLRPAPGARAGARAGAGRRARAQWPSSTTGEKHGRGAAHGVGQATALALCGARHPAGRCRALVLKAAGWRMRLCAMPCGAGERSPVSAADLGEGESVACRHARPARRNSQ